MEATDQVQLKMVFAVIFQFVMSHFQRQKRSAISGSQQPYNRELTYYITITTY